MRLAILTGGGDVPGLNSCIKAVVMRASEIGWEVVGFRRDPGFLFIRGEELVDPLNAVTQADFRHFYVNVRSQNRIQGAGLSPKKFHISFITPLCREPK